MSQKKVYAFGGCEIKKMRLISKTEMLINQSKAKLDEKILFGKLIHHVNPEIRKKY